MIYPSSAVERRNLFIESFINAQDKVTKVTDNSVLSGIAQGCSRISGLVEKDVIVYFSRIFPEYSFGENLDAVAKMMGIKERFGSLPSTTYVLVRATPGTQYLRNNHIFQSTEGFTFQLDADIEMNTYGYDYFKVTCTTSGSKTNIKPFSISSVSNVPSGHLSCFNEIIGTGGRDAESDELLRRRLKEFSTFFSRNTLSYLEKIAQLHNENILMVQNQGFSENGEQLLGMVTQNGSYLTDAEKASLTDFMRPYLSLVDMYSLKIVDIPFQDLDVSTMIDLEGKRPVNDIVFDIQRKISDYLDFRYWGRNRKIEWDRILEIVKNVEGVRYVYDNTFMPRVDIQVYRGFLPRLRSFLIYDKNKQPISEFTGLYNPVLFIKEDDYNFKNLLVA